MKRTNYFWILLFLLVFVLMKFDIRQKHKNIECWRKVYMELSEKRTDKTLTTVGDTLNYEPIRK